MSFRIISIYHPRTVAQFCQRFCNSVSLPLFYKKSFCLLNGLALARYSTRCALSPLSNALFVCTGPTGKMRGRRRDDHEYRRNIRAFIIIEIIVRRLFGAVQAKKFWIHVLECQSFDAQNGWIAEQYMTAAEMIQIVLHRESHSTWLR